MVCRVRVLPRISTPLGTMQTGINIRNGATETPMTREEIISQIIKLLNQELAGLRGPIAQKIYKHDFFELFREAYHQGLLNLDTYGQLTGDALAGIITERWLTEDEASNEKKAELMRRLLVTWDEWRYAWDHYEK